MSAARKLTIWEEPDAQRVGLRSLPPANDNSIKMIAVARENSRLGIFFFAHTSLPACEPANDGYASGKPEAQRTTTAEPGITGKEEDVEVGLQYFGKRYLNPLLGRWISADPLAVHAPGEADLNVYAYVKGHVLKSIDPLGLDELSEAMARIDQFEASLSGQNESSGVCEEAAPRAQFSVTARRFAPFRDFGGGFEGDSESRGLPSDSEGAGQGGHTTNSLVSKRIETVVNVNGADVKADSESDPSSHPIRGTDVGSPSTSVATGTVTDTSGQVSVESAGSNPLIPAPAIDTEVRFAYLLEGGTLSIVGTVYGDDFPNLEVYATDPSGNSVMLGEFQTKHGELTGPFGNLWGDGGRGVGDAIMTFEMKAPVDSEGKFIGSANVETSTSTPAPTDSAYNATESSD